ncbi:DUF7427 family protein [Nocardia transvalensis]|uniref:DUF7427 family protein n=1 Tax=Nocardia transvalensis TaxID=37333 RepID=UPI0018955C5C|nr:hypothetical protein [Nocardia transvalensis]MBF6332389.1 hypothetical protein [Nocardia transvalensis]
MSRTRRAGNTLTGETAVAVLVGLTLAHELTAGEDQLLSHAFDRWLNKHPVLTTLRSR